MATRFLLIAFAICKLMFTVGLNIDPIIFLRLRFDGQLSIDPTDIQSASQDFGLLSRAEPMAVLHPASAEDVVRLIKSAYDSPFGFKVSARGHGHSVNGQAMAGKGDVVVEMSGGLRRWRARVKPRVWVEEMYVDVWGGELWVDVLRCSLVYGLAPKSWTDYLYLSVGGTLSNGGISGQAFDHGPQISNVYELDVVTGKGELLRCSKEENPELFNAVLGGLGQFGIITRARIALEHSPQRVRWIRVLYSNFSAFTHDQEYLISLDGNQSKFDYVEGFVILDNGFINNWRSSFVSSYNPVKLTSIASDAGGVLYCLEIAKYYFDWNADFIDKEVECLLEDLNFIATSVFTSDVTYFDFLDRVHKAELKLRSKGLWEVPHPWLNLFVPKSRIHDFDRGVFKGILGNKSSGPILIYPMNRTKWDHKSSAVTPEEEVFYLVALLRSATISEGGENSSIEYLTNQNREILRFCEAERIKVKQYLPHYRTGQEWVAHFGGDDKWGRFKDKKMMFDPKHVLANGQSVFAPSFTKLTSASW